MYFVRLLDRSQSEVVKLKQSNEAKLVEYKDRLKEVEAMNVGSKRDLEVSSFFLVQI